MAETVSDGADTAKVMVITGSASGIGRELALLAARSGNTVVVNSRRRQRLDSVVAELEQTGAGYLAIEADLRDPEQVDHMMTSAAGAFGRVDILVNNAAGLFFSRTENVSVNGWRAVLDTCLTTAFLCSKAVFPYLRKNGSGAIWNVSSVAAYRPHPGAAHYAAAKAGINSLTETLATEWGPVGIQVNGIAFGPVWTKNSRFEDDGNRRSVEAQIPGGRIATASEAAAIALGLIRVTSPYFTGETVRVDGGFRGVLENPHTGS